MVKLRIDENDYGQQTTAFLTCERGGPPPFIFFIFLKHVKTKNKSQFLLHFYDVKYCIVPPQSTGLMQCLRHKFIEV